MVTTFENTSLATAKLAIFWQNFQLQSCLKLDFKQRKGGCVLSVPRQLWNRRPIILTKFKPNISISPMNRIKNQVLMKTLKAELSVPVCTHLKSKDSVCWSKATSLKTWNHNDTLLWLTFHEITSWLPSCLCKHLKKFWKHNKSPKGIKRSVIPCHALFEVGRALDYVL